MSEANRGKVCNTLPASHRDLMYICRMCIFMLVGAVKECYVLQLPVKDSCIVHDVAPNRPTASADVKHI